MQRIFITFDRKLYEGIGVLQALLHFAAIVARVAGAQISQPQ